MTFDQALEEFVSLVQLKTPQGVLVEIDHFMPDDWEARVEDGVFVVEGPSGPEWKQAVKPLIAVLAYPEGSLVRRVSPHRRELYTWVDKSGSGFKVVFLAGPVG